MRGGVQGNEKLASVLVLTERGTSKNTSIILRTVSSYVPVSEAQSGMIFVSEVFTIN